LRGDYRGLYRPGKVLCYRRFWKLPFPTFMVFFFFFLETSAGGEKSVKDRMEVSASQHTH
jgi:hypothetical protein